MSKYVLEFEKGGTFEVEFLNAAPKTAEAFKKALPISGKCLQARFAGEEFFFQAPIDTALENQVKPYHGAIAFNCDPEWKAVCIYYGDAIEMGEDEYFNLFAEVKHDLDKLNEVGVRIWTQGEEKVIFKEI